MNILSFIKRSLAPLIVLVICFSTASSIEAAVPKLLTYQGVLKNSSGSFLTGTYSMTFRIYSASTGGSSLWSETQSSVSASSGKFSVQLGSVTALNLDFSVDYWLSIQVGADAEMSPRIRLTSMGYGIRSDYENNGFTQVQHDALTHKNIEGVKDNTVSISKTNFKVDAYALATANSMGDMIIDTFTDASGINSGASSNYTWRGSSNYDVILSVGGIDSYAKLALHANGTDASTTFTDSSSGAKTVTANGNAQVDTAQSKFGGAAALFDGTGDSLSLADSADWDFGTSDFTIDFWYRFNAFTNQVLFDVGNGGASGGKGVLAYITDTQVMQIYVNGNKVFQVTLSMATGNWYHFAVVRSGTTVTLYQGGISKASGTDSADVTGSTAGVRLGVANSTGYSGLDANGWMDEFRISKGVARWTSNFDSSLPSAEYFVPAGSATVISNAYTEPTAPTEALVTADETLGTGSITYYVSRDNGTTWTTCPKETVTSISSQPSGTQLKWKVAITGNAELNAIAVAV
jgi:hypothetical protein